MHRLTAILLLAVFCLPFLVPMLALGQPAEASLPLCCRRNGQHHCMMSMAEKSQLATGEAKEPRWRAPFQRCPYCPASVSAAHLHDTFAAPPAQAFYAGFVSHPAGTVQTESKRRIAQDRARQKRGPPTLRS